MALEDHPKFPEWLAALEHMVKAHSRLKCVASNAPNRHELEAALKTAKSAYRKIADELN
jgi:hypothetical protein